MLTNSQSKNVKRKHPHPDSVYKINGKSKLPKQAKDADESLVRLQNWVLDAASPLVNLESAHKGMLTQKDAAGRHSKL